MSPPFQPLQLLLVMFAGWVKRHQFDLIAYLQEENRVLTERLGGRRIRFTDAERNHQGLENRIPQPMSVAALPHHPVQRRQLLGAMLSYYHRVAA